MEFLEIPFFDDDFLKLIFRFVLNTFFSFIVVFLYYRSSKKKEYVFMFSMVGLIIFFLCFTLKKFELDLGMALGLFAIFGILRYRTTTIPTKEMTYFFIIIGMSVMNALANKKMSFAEILFSNSIILLGLLYLESKKWLGFRKKNSRILKLDNIDNIHEKHHSLLKKELEKNTGLLIEDFEIQSINFKSKTAILKIYY